MYAANHETKPRNLTDHMFQMGGEKNTNYLDLLLGCLEQVPKILSKMVVENVDLPW